MNRVLTATSLLLATFGLAADRTAADTATRLTTDPTIENFPAWSPDGTQIAFTRETALDPVLYLLPVAGGPAVPRLGNTVGVQHPTWSPDGSNILYSRLGVLWVVPVVGGVNSQVSSPLDGGHPDEAPAWSTNDKIAIQTKIGSESNYAIATVHPLNGTIRLTPAGASCTWPSWAPGGTRFVYSIGPPGDLVTRAADGGGEAPLITWPSNETQPEWSPHGGWIAFASDAAGNMDIWIVPSGGGDAVQVTNDPALDMHPTWSPDETRIAFTSLRSGNFDLWVIDVASLPVHHTSWSAIKGQYGE